MAAIIIAILAFLILAGGLSLLALRQVRAQPQIVVMTLFAAAIVFGIFALALLTFFRLPA